MHFVLLTPEDAQYKQRSVYIVVHQRIDIDWLANIRLGIAFSFLFAPVIALMVAWFTALHSIHLIRKSAIGGFAAHAVPGSFTFAWELVMLRKKRWTEMRKAENWQFSVPARLIGYDQVTPLKEETSLSLGSKFCKYLSICIWNSAKAPGVRFQKLP